MSKGPMSLRKNSKSPQTNKAPKGQTLNILLLHFRSRLKTGPLCYAGRTRWFTFGKIHHNYRPEKYGDYRPEKYGDSAREIPAIVRSHMVAVNSS
jgi:hypothetical protein